MQRHAGIFRKLVLVIVILTMIPPSCLTQNQVSIEGNWQGVFRIRLIFKISSDEEGNLTATFDSPDQEAINIPVSKVTFDNDTLRIQMDVLIATFVGTMNYDEQVIEGHFIQGGLKLPIRLERMTTLLEHMAPRVTESGERQRSYVYAVPEETNDGWETAPMSTAGIDSSKIYEAVRRILSEEYKDIHALLVVKEGRIIVEEYF